ncbi:hypothetical protein SLS64_012138 [Diaporthe eres]|uniref:Zn(2)-C6 fungal-type domain-containing protein n=1 Tax=Diaporthe eres TaxID=83184 RepID=A0ABR1P191_DIAER
MGYFTINQQPYGMHDPMGMRYGLPPGLYDPRMQLSGGRHKKCDETHPTCNNCKKSKRECLGYDPIFKQQQTPSALQPAPSGGPSPSASTISAAGPSAPSGTPAPYTTHPTPVLTPSDPPAARESSDDSATVKTEPFEPARPPVEIDPALDKTGPPAFAASSAVPAPLTAAPSPTTDFTVLQPGDAPLRVKMPKVDEIIDHSGAAPRIETSLRPTPQSVEELTKIYYEIYVPGLCQFFESQWFNFQSQGHNSISIFLHNDPLISLLGSFLVSLHTVNADPNHFSYCGHLETRVVWALAKLAYTIPSGVNMPRDDPLPENNPSETRNRVHVFEALLNGETLTSNPLIPPPRNADQHRRKEYEFWYSLAEFLRLQDQTGQEQHLQRLRSLLDGRENRDVLYSLAIIRDLGPRFGPGYENKIPDHLDEGEPRNKLHVATQFIKAEASATGGTTNVIRQLAFVAFRALVNPGFNIVRKY